MAEEGGAPGGAPPAAGETEQRPQGPPADVEPAPQASTATPPAAAEGDGQAGGNGEELAALPPDHPLLRRAQEALHRQLAEQKLRLQEELRERKKALKDAKQRREDVGVELYGFQQQLAKLQLALERAGDAHTAAAAQRAEADSQLAALRAEVAAAEKAAAAEEARAEELQGQLDGLAATLLAVQRHNEAAAGELAVAKRQAYATEGAVAAAEAAKAQQDYLIDGMQQQLRRLGRAATLQAEALEAQRREAAAAREYLAAALAGMEGVAYEKKQLLGQWRGALRAMGQRDTALEGLQETLRKQAEQQAAVLTEQEGARRQLAAERQRTEAAAAVEKNLGKQAQRLAGQIERVQARQAELKERHTAMQRQLLERQAEVEAAAAEAARLAGERATLERQQALVGQEAATAERQLLDRLGEQTFAEKGAASTLREIQAVRARIAEREEAAERQRAVLEKLGADTEARQAGNAALAATLAGLERALTDKAAGVASLEAALRAGHAEVEARTRQLELLNARYRRLVESQKDVETGPLEATIANLQRELAARAAASRELQRRWISVQGVLVGLQAENAELAEAVAAMRAQQVVMQQKRARLNSQLEAQQREAQALAKQLSQLHAETSRLNGLLAQAAGQRSALREDNTALEAKLTAELKVLEGRWAALNSSIEELRAERAEVLAAVVEAEREVLVWERRVQLEKEMQDAVDPAYGNEELAALRKEVQRLTHTAGELARSQEAMVQEMERAVAKREVISTKAKVSQSQHIQDMTAAQAKRQTAELAKAVAATEREGRAADGRLAQLDADLTAAQGVVSAASQQCEALQAQEAGVRVEIEALGLERYKALVATTLRQKEAKRYEEAEAGRYMPAAPAALAGGEAAAAAIAAEAERAQQKQDRLRAAMAQQVDRNQIWQWFSKIDTNQSRTLDVMELQRALALGGLNFSLKTVQAMMRLHDRDGSGHISFEEFEKLHIWLSNISQSFRHFDADRGGTLDKGEAGKAVAHAGYRLDPPAFDALFTSFDPDRTNTLCLAEFMAMCTFLQGAARTFHAFDPQRSGRVTLDFSQFVYAASNVL
ncbi:Coiled-coil domain-containing 40 isoform C [Chlorella sorokiniana]|uniref:Coiled-coil domain-containing 40 isoform C n=1 Tax=Chlorella sorokiniana TaxID=3076 RepID=A0A2P6TKY1_CHLSO|nr:Coiled-coil domain-containing 40 isoform C [Chlorella sorokiniana]|eukprot:PRW44941.1 Coiled-coil domain-containing 40 isoform C [Chlorella sorokiniana]